MPDWMEQYRPLMINTGGKTVEQLMTIYYNSPGLLGVNFGLGTLAVGMAGQVELLCRLQAKRLLSDHVGEGVEDPLPDLEPGA